MLALTLLHSAPLVGVTGSSCVTIRNSCSRVAAAQRGPHFGGLLDWITWLEVQAEWGLPAASTAWLVWLCGPRDSAVPAEPTVLLATSSGPSQRWRLTHSLPAGCSPLSPKLWGGVRCPFPVIYVNTMLNLG